MTVSELIIDAMGLIGAIAADETPTASEYALGLRRLNGMLGQFSAQRLLIRSTTPITVPLVAGQASYTIGLSGANVTANKPISIESAHLVDGSLNDSAIEVISIEEYNNYLSDKQLSSGEPMYIAYDPGAAQQVTNIGTLYVYFIPDQTYSLKLEVDSYLTEFVAITDTVTFEPMYYEPLLYNLAIRLFRHYRDPATPVPGDMMIIAKEGLTNLRTVNKSTIKAGIELPGRASTYNVMTDGYNN